MLSEGMFVQSNLMCKQLYLQVFLWQMYRRDSMNNSDSLK